MPEPKNQKMPRKTSSTIMRQVERVPRKPCSVHYTPTIFMPGPSVQKAPGKDSIAITDMTRVMHVFAKPCGVHSNSTALILVGTAVPHPTLDFQRNASSQIYMAASHLTVLGTCSIPPSPKRTVRSMDHRWGKVQGMVGPPHHGRSLGHPVELQAVPPRPRSIPLKPQRVSPQPQRFPFKPQRVPPECYGAPSGQGCGPRQFAAAGPAVSSSVGACANTPMQAMHMDLTPPLLLQVLLWALLQVLLGVLLCMLLWGIVPMVVVVVPLLLLRLMGLVVLMLATVVVVMLVL